MTVSLALRDSPKISAVTRERIRKIALQLGYQPDPELSRLMKHLRLSRTAQGKTDVAIVDFYPATTFAEGYYMRKIRAGATARAGELGFNITTIHAADYHFNLKHILNVIRHRGIEGLLLLPPAIMPLQLDPTADWRDISVVATSNSILAPRFHSVVPHQFANMMRLLEKMKRSGHRRVCAIFDEFFDERTAHNFTAAVDWHRHGRRTLVLPWKLSPAQKRSRVAQWIARQKPDLIFAQASDSVESALPLLKKSHRPNIVGLGTETTFSSHLDERPDLVGTAAIDLLAGMMYFHETGIPEHPRTTMIDCEFHFDTVIASAL